MEGSEHPERRPGQRLQRNPALARGVHPGQRGKGPRSSRRPGWRRAGRSAGGGSGRRSQRGLVRSYGCHPHLHRAQGTRAGARAHAERERPGHPLAGGLGIRSGGLRRRGDRMVFAERDDTDTLSSSSTVPAPHHPRDPRITTLDHPTEANPMRTLQNMHRSAHGLVRSCHPSS